MDQASVKPIPLPPVFADWFAARGWAIRRHQRELLDLAAAGRSALLVAPTGAGKTLAGFLPSLVELYGERDVHPLKRRRGLHTLYISPLKALAVDIARNLEQPAAEMKLGIRVETRTGDTPAEKRRRQRGDPPDILLTTPEQLALLLSHRDAGALFAGLRAVVLDELHAIENTKRGDLLALGLGRLASLAPAARRVGLSATVADPDRLRRYLVPQFAGEARMADLVLADAGAPPEVAILRTSERIPWAGHRGAYAMAEIMGAIKAVGSALVFVNTRSQAEATFQALWQLNDDNLPIALHHGSLAVEQRRKVEQAMTLGRLRAVVCTSTLELGVDWGAIDLVIQLGAPKGSSRMMQRIGRANHRLDEPSRALFVPTNRFEVLECVAARQAIMEGIQDGDLPRPGGLDVLAQHVVGRGCAEPFDLETLVDEVTAAAPYAALDRETVARVLDFAATGGYALRRYEQYHKLERLPDGRYTIASRRAAQQYRLNVGTIVEAPMIRLRSIRRGGKGRRTGLAPQVTHVAGRPVGRAGFPIGEVEEWFIEQLRPGDTFLFAGQVWRFEGMAENEAYASRTEEKEPMVPSYQGGKFPLSTFLAARVRAILADPDQWRFLPGQVSWWLDLQRAKSAIPGAEQMLVETFPRGGKHYLACYPFEGRLAHQTLGMLLTQRLEAAGLRPMGFMANDYALTVWALRDMSRLDLHGLFSNEGVGDGLDAWMAESNLIKRTFRTCATIAGLIERRHPGHEKTGRQMTVNSDLIYEVLGRHEPDHILLRATREDVSAGLLDLARMRRLLERVRPHGRILHRHLERISPLAAPLMMEIGRESVGGEANEDLLSEVSDEFMEILNG
ncbi:MAG: ligase-associated DNA damage response DEXH box helicase [Alphaproteobacteria bacterium]|nr:ligase-associated DNA damage response DEXH box helicase [Alphaproteobacteria bacterium]